MLATLFGSEVKEKILLYIFVNHEAYATEIARNFNFSLYSVQHHLVKFEDAGILYSQKKGHTRFYGLNPRSPFKNEISSLLARIYNFLTQKDKDRFFIKRKRPRKAGKE